jgi:hypothetical protein
MFSVLYGNNITQTGNTAAYIYNKIIVLVESSNIKRFKNMIIFINITNGIIVYNITGKSITDPVIKYNVESELISNNKAPKNAEIL